MSDSDAPAADPVEVICQSVVKNVQEDRAGLKKIIQKLDEETLPELAPMLADSSVKAYEALTRMNAQLLAAATVLRKRGEPKSSADDIFDEIGDAYAGQQ
jgi:uncharacterized protein with von Willebrand factor type A (vWA) domain